MLLLLIGCAPTGDTAGSAWGLFATQDTGASRVVKPLVLPEQTGVPVIRRVLDRPPITLMPIIFDEDRMQLTAEHLSHHLGLPVTDDLDASTRMDPKVVVLHWTAGPSARSAFWTFFSPRRRRAKPHHQLNLSAHFVVDRDGTILQLMDSDRVGCHVVGLNHLAIGIENVGDRRRWPLTKAQVTANIALVRYLAQKYDLTHLIGHYEFKRFQKHAYWLGPDGHNIGRADPGEEFMGLVRGAVQDLDLLGAPAKVVAERPIALIQRR